VSASTSSRVASLWRYPVKSMAGEQVPIAQVTRRGFLGDRVYALVDRSSNRAATVRTWGSPLLSYRCEFLAEPQEDEPAPAVSITAPDGNVFVSNHPDAEERLSAVLGRNLTLMTTDPAGLLVEFPAGTLGGKLSDATEVPLSGAAPAGTFFDYACVHLIATSTIRHLESAYPQGRFEIRRFRPNIVVQTDAEAFVENSWAGRTFAIGEEVVLRGSIPCPRCVNTTLPQDNLRHDSGILRTIAQKNLVDLGDFGKLPCAGVYADLVRRGRIRPGDLVQYLD
jgi:uncharacterized protein YcbX